MVAARGNRTYESVLELSRRTDIQNAALVRLSKTDAFRSLELARRDASWAIKGLKDDELPLFAPVDQCVNAVRPEQTEPQIVL